MGRAHGATARMSRLENFHFNIFKSILNDREQPTDVFMVNIFVDQSTPNALPLVRDS